MTDSYKLNLSLEHFIKNAGHKPYNKLVESHIRKRSANEIKTSVQANVMLLPKQLKENVEFFFDDFLKSMLFDKVFWTLCCKDAYTEIMVSAIEVFELHYFIPSIRDSYNPLLQDFSFNIFEMATSHFAFVSINSKEFRKLIGIKKGVLFR